MVTFKVQSTHSMTLKTRSPSSQSAASSSVAPTHTEIAHVDQIDHLVTGSSPRSPAAPSSSCGGTHSLCHSPAPPAGPHLLGPTCLAPPVPSFCHPSLHSFCH
ncbi:uncharacterized protein ACO6RY_03074 [Pungitius sinensis]